MESIEKIVTPETKEDYSSKIELSFFRHAEKENDKSKDDIEIRLTEAGKKQASEKSDTENIEQSVAFGSPRKRTQETAGLVMAGNQLGINGDETLEELKEKLDQNIKIGSKIGTDEGLNFDLANAQPDFLKTVVQEFKSGNFLKFLIENSDALAEETGDKTSLTYLRGASGIAKIVDKYLKIAPRWDILANDDKKEYTDTLERFLGTHQAVSETFLAKVIEKTVGAEERDRFIQVLNNQGFGYTEGFNVEILNHGQEEPTIHITYKKEGKDGQEGFEFDKTVSAQMIKDMILEEKA
ncbi:MAG: histidine phosphatase family protein [Patescibacteria group bacterium]